MSYQGKGVRLALGVQYAALSAAGVWMVASPSSLLESSMGKVVLGWACFLVIGGMLSALGTITTIMAGEFLGLILIIFANVIWGGVLIGAGSPNSAKYGIVLIGWAFGLFARWLQVAVKYHNAAKAAREETKGG